MHPSVLQRLRTEDEKLITEMEKRYFGKLSFRADPALHAEHFAAAADKLREAGRLGSRDRRLGSLLTLSLIKAGQRALYEGRGDLAEPAETVCPSGPSAFGQV